VNGSWVLGWTLVRHPDGRPKAILAIDTDITERKKIEAQFLRAQRLENIGMLAGGIAHDLNNALSPIMMSLELLSLRFPDPKSTELLSTLRTSAQHGADMVRQVLSFARGVEGRRIEVPLGHLIQEIEKIANDTFLKQIRIETRIPKDLWPVVGDPTQIHQVLLNLCVNARDAMPGGGTLSLAAANRMLDPQFAALNLEAKVGRYVCLEVSDSGTGIPPALLEKIFDPFFTTKELGKGTGLGLSTSLAIITSHGGFLRVESAPESGTTFKVYLPAHGDAVVAKEAHLAAPLPRGHGELILVVDDDESMRVITQATLEAFGYQVLLACDGAEAIALYGSRHPEIAAVLTDMTMPVMDGETTIQLLKKVDPRVRVVAVSGLPITQAVASRCGLEKKYFLPKPFTAETLLTVLRQVLTREC
jgi:signal transduction histidine kinase